MYRKVQNLLKVMLLVGAGYLFVDGLIHFFDIKLLSAGGRWPDSAAVYARLINKVAGAFIILAAAGAFIAHKNPEQYRAMIYVSAAWSLFLGLTFIYLKFSTDYSDAFKFFPSLYFWLPFYGQYLLLEAAALIFYSIVVFLWFRSKLDE